jgi:hypothetical protein
MFGSLLTTEKSTKKWLIYLGRMIKELEEKKKKKREAKRREEKRNVITYCVLCH